MASVTLAAALLGACGGGSSRSSESTSDSPALKASNAGELTSYVQRVLRERAAQRQAGNGLGGGGSVAPALGAAPASPPAFSTSLTQERDVDEPDLLKTDGTHLYSLDLQDTARPLLRTTRRLDGGALQERAALPLTLPSIPPPAGSPPAGTLTTQLSPRGLVLATDQKSLTVASEGWAGIVGNNPCADLCPPSLVGPGPIWLRSLVAVERVDVADPANPTATTRLEFDGRLVDARRVGNYLLLVSEHQPLLAADQLPTTAPAAEREAAIAATRGADLLPRRRLANGATSALMSETDCWVQPANASPALAVTTLTVLDLRAADLAPVNRCFIGGTEALYMTTQSIYVASTRWAYLATGAALRYPATMRTDIHKFAFEGATGRIGYRASGDVEGHLGWDAQRKSYRLGEHDGALRVLTFTGTVGWFSVNDAGTTPPSPATLTVLREAATVGGGGALHAVATLPNARRPQALGKAGEQVHGVRLAGPRGYVVTFRQIDPLYVLDLSDAADPHIAGVLEVPGFSDHLVPLSDKLLLGVGKEADFATGRAGGVKVSLFDVADAAKPREVATRTFGSAGSHSGLDASRQGLSMLAQGRSSALRLSMPLALFDAGFTNFRDGLLRLEVDLSAATLASKPLIAPPDRTPAGQLAQQRSVLIGPQVVWLHGGRLSASDW